MSKRRKAICGSCGASIVWATTMVKKGGVKRIPLNFVRVRCYELTDQDPPTAMPLMEGGLVGRRDSGPDDATVKLLYVSHFTTCPNASEHSKGGA